MRPPRRAFTLIELLVVVAIIAALIALLLPAVQSAREAARRLHCSNNLRQIGLAMHAYENDHAVFPPAYTRDPGHNVLTFLLPYLELQAVHDRYDWSLPWDDAANRSATRVNLAVFVCPSAPGGRRYVADYATCGYITTTVRDALITDGQVGPRDDWDGLLPKGPSGKSAPSTSVAQVGDGLSNTFMLFEDAGRPLGYLGDLRDGLRGHLRLAVGQRGRRVLGARDLPRRRCSTVGTPTRSTASTPAAPTSSMATVRSATTPRRCRPRCSSPCSHAPGATYRGSSRGRMKTWRIEPACGFGPARTIGAQENGPQDTQSWGPFHGWTSVRSSIR